MPKDIQYFIMACMILASMAYVVISTHLFNKKYRRQKEAADYYESKFDEMFFMLGNKSDELRVMRSENDRLQWELDNAKELIANYETEILAKEEENNDDKK